MVRMTVHNCETCASMLIVDCPNCGGFDAHMAGEMVAQNTIADWLQKWADEDAVLAHCDAADTLRNAARCIKAGKWRAATQQPPADRDQGGGT